MTRHFQTTNGEISLCLDDFVQHITGCKASYLTKIKDKNKRDGLWCKDAGAVVSELCPKLRSEKDKEFQEKWTRLTQIDEVETPDQSEDGYKETVASFLDIRNNYFQYKGKKVLP